MVDKLIALLDNNGLLFNQGIDKDAITSLTPSKIRRFFEEVSEITTYENLPPHRSLFTHSASLSLGGERMPCVRLECRLEKLNELIQFATFYSDRVYIKNFTYSHVLHESFASRDKSRLQMLLLEDVFLLNRLLPLIERGYIVPVTFPNICPHCLASKSISSNSDEDVNRVTQYLQQRYLEDVKYYVEKTGSHYGIIAEGPEELLPHGQSFYMFSGKSPAIKEHPDIFRNLKANSITTLSREQVLVLQPHNRYVEEALGSLAFELGSSHNLKTSYLSESELEIKILQDLTSDSNGIRRSNLMQKYLTCVVPFISDLEPIDLIKLREGEGEHFIVFRQALNKAIDEYKKDSIRLTERDARAIYSEIIEPHIARLDVKMKTASRKFQKNTRRKITSWVGAISTGFITGLFTSNFLAGTAAFGAVKAGADLIDDVMSSSDTEESIRDDDMYFLWKVRKLSKK
jgi:hypothetical protein